MLLTPVLSSIVNLPLRKRLVEDFDKSSKGPEKKLKSSQDLDESFVKSSQDLGEVSSSTPSTIIYLGRLR